MNKDEMQALQDQMDAEVKEMDAESASWEASKRAEYEAERDNVRGMFSAWGDKTEAEWDQLKANVEQGWHGLRAKWHHGAGGSDSEVAESGNLLDDVDDTSTHS